MTKIHVQLKGLRLKHGMTQQQIAGLLNCSVPAYSKLETGATDVTGTRITQLAAIYGIHPADIHRFGEPVDDSLKRILAELREQHEEDLRSVAALQRKLISFYEGRNGLN
jgi:transcriptional regulator with XRE-family HTH domain